jgi:leucyl aminopeptidase (aminopeptidase T)
MPERTLLTLGPYVLLAVGLAASLYLFLSLKKDLRSLRRALAAQGAQAGASQTQTRLSVDDLALRLADAEQRAGVLVPPAAPKSGLNLNKRAQAIRMSRRGEAPERIAAVLTLPRKEVELLLKVQALSADFAPPGPPAARASPRSPELLVREA